MRNSSENQRDNGVLSDYFSPGSKVRAFYIPHLNPAFAPETPMKLSQIPNCFPHQPHGRPLPFQSSMQHQLHRPHFGMAPCRPPPPPGPHHHDPVMRQESKNYTCKQQHYPRARAPQGLIHEWPPVPLPLPHLRPPVSHVNHMSRDVALPEGCPLKVESGRVEAVPMMKQDKPSGQGLCSALQKVGVPRQCCDSWSSCSSALRPVTDQGRRASFPLPHTASEDQNHEVTASQTSNTNVTHQKRCRESVSDGKDAKKPCLQSVLPDKTVKCPSSDVLHRQLPGLDCSPKIPESTESLHTKSANTVPSLVGEPKCGVKQACIKSSNTNVLILTSAARKGEITTKAHEDSKKKDIPTTPALHRNNVSANDHTMPNDPRSLLKDSNCSKLQAPKPSTRLSSARKSHRARKTLLPDDLNDLDDPVYIVNKRVQPDEKCNVGSGKNKAQTPVPIKEKTSSAKATSDNVTYLDGVRISLPTVSVVRLVLPLKGEKDAATPRRPSASPSRMAKRRDGAEKKRPTCDNSLDLDMDIDLDARTILSSDSEDEPLVSLQEIMRKVPDTPEKGAFSEASTPSNHDNHKRQHHALSSAKTANYKNNLDQMLEEISTSKKAKKTETELLIACQEDLLRIAEFEEAELNKEEPLSVEHQQILQRYSLLASAIREVPPGHDVFHLEKFGRIFNQNTLQLRQCMLNPQETAQKTLLWSSHAQFKLYVNIGLFQEAYECSPCPFPITRFLFKMMCIHSDRMLSLKILQVLTDIAYLAATQILSGSRTFRVWVPSVADVTLVLLNMGVPFVSLFPLESLQPPFTEGDLLENVYIKSESPSNQIPSTFPEHNCTHMFKYLDYCLGLCPRAFSDGELLLLLTVLCTVSLETRFLLQACVELEPLLYKLLNNIRRWEDMMPKICLAVTELTEDHHNMCHLVQLLPDHTRGTNLRRHLSLSMISKLLDGTCLYRAKAKELQLSDLRLYVQRMKPSSLLRIVLRSSQETEGEKDTVLLDQQISLEHCKFKGCSPHRDIGISPYGEMLQVYYLCYSLLTLTNEATNVQFFPAHQKAHLQILCSELERHVKCHIRESEKCLYRSKVKDLVARVYTKWQLLLQKTRPLNGKLYDYWQPLQIDSGGNLDIEEIASSQEEMAGEVKEDVMEMEDGAKMEDDKLIVIEEEARQNKERPLGETMRQPEETDEDGELNQFVAKESDKGSFVEEEKKAKCTFEMETGGEGCTQKEMGTEHSSEGPPEEPPFSEPQCGDMQRLPGATALLALVHTS